MAAIGASVAATSWVAPRVLLRILGLPAAQSTPATALALRLFAVRTAYVSALTARGDRTATRMFLPVQALDQLAWWDLYRRGELGLRPTLTCSAISAGIVAFGLSGPAVASGS